MNSLRPAPIAAAHMHVALERGRGRGAGVRLALGGVARRAATPSLVGPGLRLGARATHPGRDAARRDRRMRTSSRRQLGRRLGRRASATASTSAAASSVPRAQAPFPTSRSSSRGIRMLFSEQRARARAPEWRGRHRAGGGNHIGFRPHGTDELTGDDARHAAAAPVARPGRGAPGRHDRVPRAPRATARVEQVRRARSPASTLGADDVVRDPLRDRRRLRRSARPRSRRGRGRCRRRPLLRRRRRAGVRRGRRRRRGRPRRDRRGS